MPKILIASALYMTLEVHQHLPILKYVESSPIAERQRHSDAEQVTAEGCRW